MRRTLHADLAQEYCREQFVANFAKPQGFCDWAWNDIQSVFFKLERIEEGTR